MDKPQPLRRRHEKTRRAIVEELQSLDICVIGTDIASDLYLASQVVLEVKNPHANAGDIKDTGSIPGWGRSPGEGNDNPLQYSRPENSMIRGAWQESMGLQIVGYN